ncbi:hypothetical protein KKC56_02225 [Patescibacteria group bacterium]|nr:hypothetical protein [Patescibacteria group bacterium]MBU1420884.1 hypothetical protein [Patescibacteria group bacterium]MBU1684258.1 hypothetical protein [Patescibacteria group bacterium]MBU1778616.1 hypothetical protein [Patescibacteria group bacterium]MBU2416122.1 hypothetical protein [Patescibacteria group bacterium]
MTIETYDQNIQTICDFAIKILKVDGLHFRPMRRKNNQVNTKYGYVLARTNLKTKLITIDIYTTKKRDAKKISSILRILCHEVAHHQKKPFRQRYKGKIINRQHYPEFYQQVNKNIKILASNTILKKYF